MSDGRPDDAMMAIGDIDEEPTPLEAEPPPRVVIEYRDRGVPWMLVPPLIAVSAVVAVVVALPLNARWTRPTPRVVSLPAPATGGDALTGEGPGPNVAAISPVLPPAEVPDPVVYENPPSLPPGGEVPPSAPQGPAGAMPPVVVDLTPSPQPAMEPVDPPTPKVAALGFDPAAIMNNPVEPNLPAPLDRNLAAVAQRGGNPTSPSNPAEQPDQVEADLPPDPRKASETRQREEIEARRKVEANRSAFHAQLAAITRRFGRRSAPAIHKLCEEFDEEIPAAAMKQAKKDLGSTGMYVGVKTSIRIARLRQLGFPETAILGDIFDIETRHESTGARNSPTQDEMYVRSALLLLDNPPGRMGGTPRSASATRTGSGSRPDRAAYGSNR